MNLERRSLDESDHGLRRSLADSSLTSIANDMPLHQIPRIPGSVRLSSAVDHNITTLIAHTQTIPSNVPPPRTCSVPLTDSSPLVLQLNLNDV